MTTTIATTMPDGTPLHLTQQWRITTPTTTLTTDNPSEARRMASQTFDARIETCWASTWKTQK